jgi:iron complex outermembrane receptor protein
MISLGGNLALSKNKIIDFTEYADYYASDFTYLGNHQLNFMKSTDICFSPAVVSSARLVLRPLAGMEVSFIGKYVSRQFLDNTSTLSRSIDPYKVLDLRINYTLKTKPEIALMFAVYNLLGEVYETNGYTYNYFVAGQREVYNYYAPAAPRNFLGGLSIRF